MLGQSKLTLLRINFAKKVSGCVLDCASGTGAYHRFFNTEDIVSLDLTFSQLKNLKGKRVCADATCLPFRENVFDVLWAFAFIQCIKSDLLEYIQDWYRVVKPRGKIYILTPNRESPVNVLLRFFHLKNWASYEGTRRLYSAKELSRYGKVYGEIWFLPMLCRLLACYPKLGHTLIVEIEVKK